MNKLLITILLLLLTINVFTQECNYINDTLYFISIAAEPHNDIPRTICGLTDDINTINIFTNSFQEFVDTLFSSVIYCKYLYLGFSSMYGCYKDSSDNFFTKIESNFWKQQSILLKNDSVLLKKGILQDSSQLKFSIVQVIGEFWRINDVDNSINNISHQAIINLGIYRHKFFYIFKKISSSSKITKEEGFLLRKKIEDAGIN